MAKVICACCGQQIIPDHTNHSPVKRLCASQHICSKCAKDLDQDGLFPEERAQAEFVRKLIMNGHMQKK